MRSVERGSQAASGTVQDEHGVICSETIDIMHINVRGWLSHIAEVTALLRSTSKKPMLLCFNETFLNKSIEHICVEGYSLVGRRDREGQFGGGVAIFAKLEHIERITLLHKSADAERLWCLVHSDQGPYAVCA